MKYKVSLNNKIYEVEVENGNAQLLAEYESLAPVVAVSVPVAVAAPVAAPVISPSAGGSSANATMSPLPGVIVEVKATVGQTVKAGDVILTIEAMKMENEVTASKGGTLVAVFVQKNTQVSVGTPLFEIA